jgi:BirA family transcriptional regulator, biotin operon repressor / biotin---[acetyl-CoA-carboxylase] ligase
MNLIKLDATDSTNDYLKSLSSKNVLENFTIITAQSQNKGRGQMGASWISEAGKNLIMSVLIKDILKNADEIFHLNVAVTLAIIQSLAECNLPILSIKWPNDIMSDNKKVCGILIENSFKHDSKIESVVGIGLNVNQKSFDNLPKASSMASIMEKEFDLDTILENIVFHIKQNCNLIISNDSEKLWNDFHSYLFKIKVPMPFEDANQNRFMGIIQGVTNDGKLEILLEDESVKAFRIKEIQLLY